MDRSKSARPVLIRGCGAGDMAGVQAIYAHHVLHGLATFEEVPPDVAEMARRQEEVLGRGLPYLVAEEDGRLLGYAYAGPYRARSAYRFAVEDSIYLDPGAMGRGFGTRLLAALIDDCTAAGARQMVAVIGDSGNAARSGCTRGRASGTSAAPGGRLQARAWVDTVVMQLPLGPGDGTTP